MSVIGYGRSIPWRRRLWKTGDRSWRPELLTSALIAVIVTLVVWFGGLAFLDWATGQDTDIGLGPDFLYIVLLPVVMAGLAWLAFRNAWQTTGDLNDDLAGHPRWGAASGRAAIVAPLVALIFNQVVWNASLDRFDWLGSFIIDPFNPTTLVVLIIFPLLLVGVTIWSAIAVQTLMTPPRPVRRHRDDSVPNPEGELADQ